MNSQDSISQCVILQDTIFALSSAAGKAGVSILRVSGAAAWTTLEILSNHALPAPKKAVVRKLYNPHDKSLIDEAMIIGFRSPSSFTGEDVIEYHCHGSQAIIDEMLTVLSQIPHCRLANHGEFTRRAFENGRLDLTEAEAIADLIDAETKLQKEQALNQMGGALSTLYGRWAVELTKALAYIEAIIDFPDEEVPDSETAKVLPAIQALNAEIDAHLNDNRKGERLRNGIQISVIGAPNVGKSSLVNLLAQRDVAIVSDIAGTTRDVIEAHLNIGGYPVIISDTAGLRPEEIINSEIDNDIIEREGIKRALARAHEADLKLLVFDANNASDENTRQLADDKAIIVVNKADNQQDVASELADLNPISISVKSNHNIDELLDRLIAQIKQIFTVSHETPSLTRHRHRQYLEEARGNLEDAIQQAEPELMAQNLRFALTALGRITGRVDVEDLLDVIFRDFCIGK